MFNKQAVDEYRSITAPDDLKGRVLQATATQKRSIARIVPIVGAIAACFAILFTASVWFTPNTDVMISSDWTLSSTASVASTGITSRTNAAHYAEFTLVTEGDFQLDTDDTIFVAADDGTLISTFPYHTSGAVHLCWYVTSPEAHMTVNGERFTLLADENNGMFNIVQD